MKILDIDWRAFLQVLEYYRRLPYGARRILVEKVQPSQAVSNAVLGEWRQALLDSGLMVAGPQAKNALVDPRYQGFCRAIRGLHRNRIFHAPSRETFHAFVSENFEGPEIAAFSGAGREYYYYQDYAAVQGVFARVCSADWVKDFLVARGPEWEAPYQAAGRSPYFSAMAAFQAAQTLILKLMPGAVPVPMAQLPGMCPECHPDTLAAAILAGFRYLLFFPCLQGEGLEPALGLWPSAARKLSSEIPRAPVPVAVTQSFHSPFLVEDMTAILAACVLSPPRLRRNDSDVFEADWKNLAAALGTLPEWVEREFHITMADRISGALDFLRHYGFVEQKGSLASGLLIAISESGTSWLRLAGKDRLKAVLDGLRGTLSKKSPGEDNPAVSLVPHSRGTFSLLHAAKIASGLLAAYAGPGSDEFVDRRAFLAYRRERDNPFAAILREERHGSLWIGGRYVSAPSVEELEELWENSLAGFLNLRLLPLGAVKVGTGPDGAICFALAGPGRYLAGAAADFQLGDESQGRILVQPNFDVVFLAPSAKAESEIARFAERRGRHVGTLFKLTKQSILEAAATGLSAARVLDSLREHCGGDLPANVHHEIAGWFGQYRPVHMVHAMLLHCPDAETATRVISVAGKRVTRLTDTTLEWHDDKPPPALLKKLREMGIFIRS